MFHKNWFVLLEIDYYLINLLSIKNNFYTEDQLLILGNMNTGL